MCIEVPIGSMYRYNIFYHIGNMGEREKERKRTKGDPEIEKYFM